MEMCLKDYTCSDTIYLHVLVVSLCEQGQENQWRAVTTLKVFQREIQTLPATGLSPSLQHLHA